MNMGSVDRRLKLFYEGRVQGVGFRYRVCTIAKRFPVVGYVRNLPDSRVELVVEGNQANLDGFLEAIRQGMGSGIERETQSTESVTSEFTGFSVRM